LHPNGSNGASSDVVYCARFVGRPFTAGEVNAVMQPGALGKAAVTVVLDGKPIGEASGADVGPDGVARFDRSGMIRLVARAPHRRHILTLVVNDPGLRVYVFTFGP
jgi:Thioredoxin like C-terminal domain